jgi:hypothetical protein
MTLSSRIKQRSGSNELTIIFYNSCLNLNVMFMASLLYTRLIICYNFECASSFKTNDCNVFEYLMYRC